MTSININHQLQDIFDSVSGLNDGDKIQLQENGAARVDERGRGFKFWPFNRSKSFHGSSEQINSDSLRTAGLLRRALEKNFGIRGAEIFQTHISSRKQDGLQRITTKDIRTIENAVKQIAAKASNAQKNEIDNARSKKLQLSVSAQGGLFSRETKIFASKNAEYEGKLQGNDKAEARTVAAAVDEFLSSVPEKFSLKNYKGSYGLKNVMLMIKTVLDNCDKAARDAGAMMNKFAGNPKVKAVMTDIQDRIATVRAKYNLLGNEYSKILQNKGDTFANVRSAMELRVASANNVIENKIQQLVQEQNARVAQEPNDDRKAALMRQYANAQNDLRTVQRDCNELLRSFDKAGQENQDISANKYYLSKFKSFNDDFEGRIRNAFKGLHSDVRLEKNFLQNEFVRQLGQRPWNTISNEVTLKINGEEKRFVSQMVPGRKMFAAPYNSEGQSVNGYASGNRTTTHACNVFKTSISGDDGKPLFTGYRHAVLDAFKIKNGQERTAANANRAKELLSTIVADNLNGRFSSQVAQGRGASPENPITFNMTSINLVNDVNSLFKTEHKMVTKQLAALDSLRNPDEHGNQRPVALEINGKTVYVKPKIIPFGVPGSKLSQSIPFFRRFCWSNANSHANNAGFANFMGRGVSELTFKASHIANGRLGTQEAYQQFLSRLDDNTPLGEFMKTASETDKKKAFILCTEINLLRRQTLASRSFDPFELSSRIALLSDLVGGISCFNCKSGKDRTGHLDIEVKQLAAKMSQIDENTDAFDYLRNKSSALTWVRTGHYNSQEDRDMFTVMAAKSGNLEIHELNCGLKGSKVNSVSGITEHFGDENVFKFHQGASKYAKS
ncbi:MAG: hypothetical protein IJ523_02260 [Succinivibrionaceae bacterium]|nr:hypothetical protein [Succinivibrionaceae bacterium]